MKGKDAIEAKYKETTKPTARSGTKRQNSTSSASGTSIFTKRTKKDSVSEAVSQRTILSMLDKDPVLSLCGAMVVENGFPFTCFDGACMQLMMSWGKKGVGDESSSLPNSSKVRDKVQDDAKNYREKLKRSFVGQVLSVSTDMASKDGRCFIGKQLFFALPDYFHSRQIFAFKVSTFNITMQSLDR